MPLPRPRAPILPSTTIASPRSRNSSTPRSQVSKFSSSPASHSRAPSCPRNGSPLKASPIAVRISTSGSNNSSGGLRSPAFQFAKAPRISSTLGLSGTLSGCLERLERLGMAEEGNEAPHLSVLKLDHPARLLIELDAARPAAQVHLAKDHDGV